jgi:transposase
MSVEQQVATGRVTAGVDWASHAHAVALVDGDGVQSQRFTVAHTATELQQMVQRLRRAGVAEVAIERPDGPVVDALLAAGLTVFVIAPNQVKNLRGRYGSAGNKDDRFDAFVLADTLRTDLARLRPLTPDSETTISLRMTVRARKGLVAASVAMANQLRAHLQSTLPGVIGLFRDIDSKITLQFLTRFPSQDKADWLSRVRLGNWLRSVGYNHLADLERLWTHLHDAPGGTRGPQAAPRVQITLALVAALSAIRDQIKVLDGQIAAQLAAHPDRHIFTSLPRAGTNRAARLLAEIGDARGRFPTPRRWPAWPAPHPRPVSPERSRSSPTGGPWTSNSAGPSSTSPATPTTPTPGPLTSTPRHPLAATTTHTQCASWPVPGCTSSGAAGKTGSPTTPPNTTPYNAS